ncbi:MAG: hypothetical protein J4F42_09720 [Desulfurellaceae bacterium]|nr:hypothetical protein [Desulfurellaceae bacterium]
MPQSPTCHQCGVEIHVVERVGRRDSCPGCEADLRCCLNCVFYDPHVSNACREPNVEPVRDKDVANFCDYFSLGNPAARPAAEPSQAADARAHLEALFAKKKN